MTDEADKKKSDELTLEELEGASGGGMLENLPPGQEPNSTLAGLTNLPPGEATAGGRQGVTPDMLPD